ncbi:MAG: hypothetical protein RLZZ358_1369 [Bacteroidota bacterium]|jgi:hypothetical protein
MYLPFDQLPDSSRVWVYVSSRSFTPAEQALIHSGLTDFCGEWATHGNGMPTSFAILYEQLIVLAVDESQLGASGCSIDSSVRALRNLEQHLGVNLVDQGKLTLRDQAGQLKVLPALGIKSRISSGEITPDLEVIQPQIHTKADLSNLWLPLSKSWLSTYFPN